MSAPRLLLVRLDHSVLTGEQHPRPRVGEIGSYGLGFSETSEYTDPDDPTLCTVRARVERLGDGRPRRSRGWDGVEHGWPRWNSLLHGHGWSAGWTTFRPPPDVGDDTVELRGHLASDFSALTLGRVRGVIRRLWTVHSRRDVPVDLERRETWAPAWGSTMLTAVDEMPMAVGCGQPWPARIPGLDYTGLLAELEIATVAPEPNPHSGGRDDETPESSAQSRQ